MKIILSLFIAAVLNGSNAFALDYETVSILNDGAWHTTSGFVPDGNWANLVPQTEFVADTLVSLDKSQTYTCEMRKFLNYYDLYVYAIRNCVPLNLSRNVSGKTAVQ
jgi:hypothetical protein